MSELATIQHLQFIDKEKAERLLQHWFEDHLNLVTESVTLTPKAVSLNSFNGFYRASGEEYFFKTHVEEQGILEEYYHAELLSQAGYNIVKPLRMLHEKDQQMVIYPVIHWPVMFDLVRAVETGNAGDVTIESLASAEQQECQRLLHIYRSTLAPSTAEEHASAPIHQLFWHRLTGNRFTNFYAGKAVPLLTSRRGRLIVPTADVSAGAAESSPSMGSSIPFDQLLNYRWIINGVAQQRTLGELVDRAKIVLNPAQSAMTIIGHGDAHFGNVFLESARRPQEPSLNLDNEAATGNVVAPLAGARSNHPTDVTPRYLYFDPAFAGRHSSLLDIIKPLFHNVFATWMYFPQDIAQTLHLSVSLQNETISLEHDYTLTPIRQAILQTKTNHLLTPLIEELHSLQALPTNWSEIIHLALMCCPLLTINLLDTTRLPTPITWLGLSMAVQMGNNGVNSWRTDL